MNIGVLEDYYEELKEKFLGDVSGDYYSNVVDAHKLIEELLEELDKELERKWGNDGT